MEKPFEFELLHVCKQTGARRGRLHTPHGVIETPIFMPVGTQASVKTMSPDELKDCGAQIILSNTYHLHLRPGEELIQKRRRPAQVHELGSPDSDRQRRVPGLFAGRVCASSRSAAWNSARIWTAAGMFISPGKVRWRIQQALGSDIMMQFDECSPYPCDYDRAKDAMHRTLRWLDRCMKAKTSENQALFGIVQGAFYSAICASNARRRWPGSICPASASAACPWASRRRSCTTCWNR